MGYAERQNQPSFIPAEARAQALAEHERMLGDILPFQSHRDGCAKCGFNQRTVAYCTGWRHGFRNVCPRDGEHLHVSCAGCGYSWLERTKQAEFSV